MIFYNNFLAKCFLGKKKHYFMIGGLFFTRYKYLEVWEEMELRIHARQFWECFLLTLIPALALSLWLSWWWMILPFIAYHLFYWFEKMFFSSFSFRLGSFDFLWGCYVSAKEEVFCLDEVVWQENSSCVGVG